MSIVRELADKLSTVGSNVQDQIDSKTNKINITGNTIGSATHIPVITYNNQGQITSTTTASIDSLPSQTNQSGKYLTTDGASASWNTITQYTPPTDQGVNNYLAGDGDYKSIDISTLEYDNSLFNLNADNVQEALDSYAENFRYWENITSAVRMFGGIIQDNGDGTVRVGSGGGLFKLKASSTPGVPPGECEPMSLNSGQAGEIFYRTWTASNSITLTNNAYNYIFILWDHTINNGDGTYGNTKVYATTNFYLTDWENEIAYYNFVSAHPELDLPARRSGMLHAFTVGRVYRMDNEVTIRVCGTNGWNYNKRAQLFGEEFFPVVRARGLQIEAATGNLQFNVTEGIMWAEAANRFTVKGFNMDEGDKFTSWYRHTAITFEGSYADLYNVYPTGIPDLPYAIVYATTSDRYYRYGALWEEVMDYINSKPHINLPLGNLSEIQSTYPEGFYNLSDGNDYVIIQLQATKQFYIFNESWEEYTLEINSTKTIVNFLGTLDELNIAYPNGYTGLINIIAWTNQTMPYLYYEFNKTNGWERVHGYNNKSGWLRFYKQNTVDVARYNDIPNNKLADLPEDSYGVAWIYMVHDNTCHVVYGQDYYNFEEAQNASLPTPLPGLLAAYSTLVGKITFTAGVTNFSNARLESPFQEKFISSGVSLHNDLAGLQGGSSNTNEFYHLTDTEHGLISSFANVVDISEEGDFSVTGNISSTGAIINGDVDISGVTTGYINMVKDTIPSGDYITIPSGYQTIVDHLDIQGELDVKGTLATITGGYLSQTTMKTEAILNSANSSNAVNFVVVPTVNGSPLDLNTTLDDALSNGNTSTLGMTVGSVTSNSVTLNTTNGSIKLVPQDGTGLQTLNIGRQPNLGKVLQVIQSVFNTEFINTSTTYINTGLTATITPSSINSKILVMISAAFFAETTVGYNVENHSCIARNGTIIQYFRRVVNIRATPYSGIVGNGSQGSLVYLDSPLSISPLTYTLQICAGTAGDSIRINKDSFASSTITLMEIAQ